MLRLKDNPPANLKYLDAQLEFKDLSETGSFSGYASIFGNVDEGGDIVERGAFKEIMKTRDGKVRVLLHHNMREPIGKATVQEDDTGLRFDGQLVMEDAKARAAHAHMKAGILDGMSIGYDILANGSTSTEAGNTRLHGLKLYEISVVTFGMNPLAKIETVKNRLPQVTTIREYEDFLREVGGFSNAQAKLLASGGWKVLQAARDENAGEEQAADDLAKFCSSFEIPGSR
jgi:HK97 family phage prohead protease